jgi:glyceraldehyde-3-phosphate dehydrogenase (NADP+)
VERFAARVAKLRGGVPWEAGVDLTPLPEPGKPAYLAELRADAVARGARCITPGAGQGLGHTFVPPSVLYPVTSDMRVWHEEQFGPLVPIGAFSDPAEVGPLPSPPSLALLPPPPPPHAGS